MKELAKANASDWLWQIGVALGISNSFKLQQSTRLQGSQRLSMEQSQTLCTNEMYESLVRTRLGIPPMSLKINTHVLIKSHNEDKIRGQCDTMYLIQKVISNHFQLE